MKKLILISAFILATGLSSLFAQKGHDIQPIPSFDYKLNLQTVEFVESNKFIPRESTTAIPPPASKEKREMEIVISSSSTSLLDVFATVWLVKVKGNVVKGPYTIYLDQQFSKEIDNGQWSVVMTCGFENVKASVWIN